MRISDWSSDVCSSDLWSASRGRASRRWHAPWSDCNRSPPVRCVSVGTKSRVWTRRAGARRSEEHTSELQSLMRISYAVFCLKKKKHTTNNHIYIHTHISPQICLYIHILFIQL